MDISNRSLALKPCDVPLFDGEMLKDSLGQVFPTFVINPTRPIKDFLDFEGRFIFDIPPAYVAWNPDEIKI